MKCWLLLVSIMLFLPTKTYSSQPDEYTLKSAFLYNFSVFTTWPDQSFATFNLCIYGNDPFGKKLDFLLQQKTIYDRAIVVHRVDQREKLIPCQFVFITQSEAHHFADIVNSLANYPILTVADSPGASFHGVMLNMNVNDGRITFEANLTQAKKVGLVLSAQLLRLATEVY
ncbi:MAG: YfiR family protein [Nitrosomonas sp.]|nr:YfiR family protein [Nitrosomonas sp.]